MAEAGSFAWWEALALGVLFENTSWLKLSIISLFHVWVMIMIFLILFRFIWPSFNIVSQLISGGLLFEWVRGLGVRTCTFIKQTLTLASSILSFRLQPNILVSQHRFHVFERGYEWAWRFRAWALKAKHYHPLAKPRVPDPWLGDTSRNSPQLVVTVNSKKKLFTIQCFRPLTTPLGSSVLRSANFSTHIHLNMSLINLR